MMSQIKGKNTKPEMIVRRALHKAGFRYRLHVKDLPGKPDIVLPKYKTAIFVHGCFWHGHNCHLFKMPSTRTEFWRSKIASNVARDEKTFELLEKEGWRVGLIWECATKGKTKHPPAILLFGLIQWLEGTCPRYEAKGVT